jgi:1-deoxy-D-xylulose-5-phosphate reductoisomerase
MYALDMFQEVIMKTVSILGSTGSIGKQTLDVCKMHNIKVKALAAHSNIKLLAEQAREFKVKTVCIYNELLYNELKQLLSDTETNILVGINGLCEIASDNSIDILVNAVVGMVGLLPTLTAIESGVDIALANKETLVAGGSLVMSQAKSTE